MSCFLSRLSLAALASSCTRTRSKAAVFRRSSDSNRSRASLATRTLRCDLASATRAAAEPPAAGDTPAEAPKPPPRLLGVPGEEGVEVESPENRLGGAALGGAPLGGAPLGGAPLGGAPPTSPESLAAALGSLGVGGRGGPRAAAAARSASAF